MNKPGIMQNLSLGRELMEEEMDTKVLQMWSRKEINSSRFYLTGYEPILFNRSKDFALESVLASVIPWDKELLILNPERMEHTHEIDNLHPEAVVHTLSHDDVRTMESLISSRRSVAYLLINQPEELASDLNLLDRILSLVRRNRMTLIVNCDKTARGINDIFMGAIDFMIGSLDDMRSFVMARRSKLVGIEGNSRKLNLDLHAFWQLCLRKRNAIIEPMVS